ncbi:hypothetical protein TpMuguga_01g01086 [Theileria parva strain Muguga]|uniref:Uncharacterized protein n=1 Tax=Theileria parva TaxID=5875 RepID=Q4N6T4_THEPA|nr:uncharacterized protein TpMuguga_01g01086 [Theileria parva strain Muguga]EAN34324.1 hypothetical protein TpMuguga_01g01086 [Theileria parva strain Muguga]
MLEEKWLGRIRMGKIVNKCCNQKNKGCLVSISVLYVPPVV